MKGDFSRWSFDQRKHYTGVLHQQGRVWLDSDWNEDVADREALLRQELIDIIGVCGVPEPGTAFRIDRPASGGPSDFVIGGGPGAEGRAYVHGLLCQLDSPASYLSQPDFPDPPSLSLPTKENAATLYALVYLEAWQRLITYLEDDELREIALGGPDTATRLKTIAQVKVLPLPTRENRTEHSCASASAFLPGPSKAKLTTLVPQDMLPLDPCRIPDAGTYTGRENHFYRVEIHDGGDVLDTATGGPFRIPLAADAKAGELKVEFTKKLDSVQRAALNRSGVVLIQDVDGQAEVVPILELTGTTLKLSRGLSRGYTTAKQATIVGGVARFKWSRDNAAFAVRVLAVGANRDTLTLASLGRDQATALQAGDLVEICDDASELGPARGHLTMLAATPDLDLLTVSLVDQLPPQEYMVDRHLLLRRWDGWGWADTTFDEVGTPDMNLGDGIHIQFGGSDLQPGDYWNFTARSADGSVERLTDAAPAGIIRYRCPLAVVSWTLVLNGSEKPEYRFAVLEDCRNHFPSLTNLTSKEQCEVTVGKGGHFASLPDAVKTLQSQRRRDWCICLLPGDHELPEGLTISNTAHGDINVNIHACTPGARIILWDQLFVERALTFTLSGVSIQSSAQHTLHFRDCGQVTLEHLAMEVKGDNRGNAITFEKCTVVMLRGVTTTNIIFGVQNIVRIEEAAHVIMEDCSLTGDNASRGVFISDLTERIQLIRNNINFLPPASQEKTSLALVIGNGGTHTILDSNVFGGIVSMYGAPSNQLTGKQVEELAAVITGSKLTFEGAAGVCQVRGNQFTRLVVGSAVIKGLRDGTVNALYQSLFLTDNVIEEPDNTLVAERLSVVSTMFQKAVKPPGPPPGSLKPRVGVVVGLAATFVGNQTPVPGAELRNLAPDAKEAANLIGINSVPVPLPG